jgi:hypothetical protein
MNMELYTSTFYKQVWSLKQSAEPFLPGVAFALGLYVVSKVLILMFWIVGKCFGRVRQFFGALMEWTMAWMYVIPSWYYGVSAVRTDDTERIIDAIDFQYQTSQGKPCVKVCLDGITYWINVQPWLALHLQNKPGKEMAMINSPKIELKDTPKGCFAFMVNGQFVGCGFRAVFNGKYQMYTAYHVWKMIKGEPNVTAHANGKMVELFQTLRMSFGEEDTYDFVMLEDSARISALGVKPLKTSAFVEGTAKSVGSTNGLIWSTANGNVDKDDVAFRFRHTSTTYPGWSGTPILNRETGAVIGIHTEAKGCGTANAGTALFSLLATVYKKAGQLSRKESYEEYTVAWSHMEREEEFQTKVRFVSETDKFVPPPMYVNDEGYYWDDDEEVDFSEPLFFPDDIKIMKQNGKENAPPPPPRFKATVEDESEEEDFQRGLETQLKTPFSNNNSNTQEEHTQTTSQTSSSSETTSGKTLEQKKAKNLRVKNARKLKKALKASSSLLAQETERKEVESQKTLQQSMLSSQRLTGSSGPQEVDQASLLPLVGTEQTSNNKENNRLSETSSVRFRKQSQNSNAAWSFEEKITFLVTGQLRVESWRPAQELAYASMEREYQDSPAALEQALRAKVAEDTYRKQMRSSSNNFKNQYRSAPNQDKQTRF